MNITKEITEVITNQADQTAVSVIIYDFNESDNAIFCKLLDIDGNMIANRRIFTFESFPCQVLNLGEKELIKGMNPTEEWYIEEIKLWLDSKEIEYQSNAIKADLLGLVDAEINS